MLTPDQKGTIAEAAVVLEAAKLGIGVLKPVNDGLRYDLALDVGERLIRLQCKWALRVGDVVVVRARTCRRGPHGYVRGLYTSDEVDGVAAYCASEDATYFLPIAVVAGRPSVSLRLEPTRNNQRLGVRWAKDFEFAARLAAHVRGP